MKTEKCNFFLVTFTFPPFYSTTFTCWKKSFCSKMNSLCVTFNWKLCQKLALSKMHINQKCYFIEAVFFKQLLVVSLMSSSVDWSCLQLSIFEKFRSILFASFSDTTPSSALIWLVFPFKSWRLLHISLHINLPRCSPLTQLCERWKPPINRKIYVQTQIPGDAGLTGTDYPDSALNWLNWPFKN